METTVASTGFAAVGLFGAVSNSLVLLTVAVDSAIRNRVAAIIASLAFADLAVCLMLNGQSWIYALTGNQNLKGDECYIWHSTHLTFASVSIIHVAAISVDRYLGVVSPLRRTILMARYHGVVVITTLVWTMAVALSAVSYHERDKVRVGNSSQDVSSLECEVKEGHRSAILAFVFSFLVPCAVILTAYHRVIRALTARGQLMDLGAVQPSQCTVRPELSRPSSHTEYSSGIRMHRGGRTLTMVSQRSLDLPLSSTTAKPSLISYTVSTITPTQQVSSRNVQAINEEKPLKDGDLVDNMASKRHQSLWAAARQAVLQRAAAGEVAENSKTDRRLSTVEEVWNVRAKDLTSTAATSELNELASEPCLDSQVDEGTLSTRVCAVSFTSDSAKSRQVGATLSKGTVAAPKPSPVLNVSHYASSVTSPVPPLSLTSPAVGSSALDVARSRHSWSNSRAKKSLSALLKGWHSDADLPRRHAPSFFSSEEARVRTKPVLLSSSSSPERLDATNKAGRRDAAEEVVLVSASSSQQRRLLSESSSGRREAGKTKLILVSIIVIFVLFWAPYFLLLLICNVGVEEDDPSCRWRTVTFWFGCSHSAVNPFLYAWSRCEFRRVLSRFCHGLLSCGSEKAKRSLHSSRQWSAHRQRAQSRTTVNCPRLSVAEDR